MASETMTEQEIDRPRPHDLVCHIVIADGDVLGHWTIARPHCETPWLLPETFFSSPTSIVDDKNPSLLRGPLGRSPESLACYLWSCQDATVEGRGSPTRLGKRDFAPTDQRR